MAQTLSASAKPTPSQITPEPPRGERLTFLEHLHEFRRRIFVVVIILLAGTMAGYAWHEQLVPFLLAPLGGQRLVYLTPGGGFDFIFKVSLCLGLALAIPVVIFQLYRYLSPVMGRTSRRMTALVIILSAVL